MAWPQGEVGLRGLLTYALKPEEWQDQREGVKNRMQVQQELERYRKDAIYFERHRQEFLRQHPERRIAVYDQQVVGTAKRLPQLIKQLEKRGLPRRRVFIEHLSAKEDVLILPFL